MFKNTSVIIILLLLFSLRLDLQSQYRGNPSRHYFGGYLGVELGLTNQFEAAPVVGYEILPWLHAGVGAKYQYYHNKRINEIYRGHLYAPVAFSDVTAIGNLNEFLPFSFLEGALFLHAEMNYFNLPVSQFDDTGQHAGSNRFFRATWLTGVGLRRAGSHRNSLHLLVMMDVSGHGRSVYSNPVVRFGFMF